MSQVCVVGSKDVVECCEFLAVVHIAGLLISMCICSWYVWAHASHVYPDYCGWLDLATIVPGATVQAMLKVIAQVVDNIYLGPCTQF